MNLAGWEPRAGDVVRIDGDPPARGIVVTSSAELREAYVEFRGETRWLPWTLLLLVAAGCEPEPAAGFCPPPCGGGLEVRCYRDAAGALVRTRWCWRCGRECV